MSWVHDPPGGGYLGPRWVVPCPPFPPGILNEAYTPAPEPELESLWLLARQVCSMVNTDGGGGVYFTTEDYPPPHLYPSHLTEFFRFINPSASATRIVGDPPSILNILFARQNTTDKVGVD